MLTKDWYYEMDGEGLGQIMFQSRRKGFISGMLVTAWLGAFGYVMYRIAKGSHKDKIDVDSMFADQDDSE